MFAVYWDGELSCISVRGIVKAPKEQALLIAILCFLPSIGFSQNAPKSQTLLEQLNSSLKELADHVSPAVVSIITWSSVTEDNQDPPSEPGAGSPLKQRVVGTGVIVEPDGFIVTNAHVVDGARRVQVTLNPVRGAETPTRQYVDMPGQKLEARVVGVDQETDLALLKIESTGLPTLPFGNYENLRQGQMVVAFGNPFGIRNVATIGIVSSVAVQLDPDSTVVYIETDAALNPGDSGGALVDTDGHLVGINAAAVKGERVGLAIPSDTVKFICEQLQRFGRVVRGDIGMEVQTITPALAAGLRLARTSGVIVSDVRSGLPAGVAGIQPQDIVISADGHPVQSALQFTTLMYQRKPGEGVTLRLLRGSRSFDANLVVAEQLGDIDAPALVIAAESRVIQSLEIMGANVDSRVADVIPGIRQDSGVLVIGADHLGSETSLKVGDIIHAINGKSVRGLTEIRQILASLPAGAPLVLRIERQKRFLYLTSEVQ